MRKKIMCLMMAAVLGLGAAAPAYAEVHKGSKSWLVNFDGSKMDSNFSSSEMAEDIYSIQPGDSIELEVAVRNSSGEATDWYMTNEVLATLEESQNVAGGGAYAYRLIYQGPDGTEDVLYDRFFGRLFLPGNVKKLTRRACRSDGKTGRREPG